MRGTIERTKYCSIVAVLRPNTIYALLLAIACLVVFAPAYTAGIINWDDDIYLRVPVSQRVSPAILDTYVMGNYHPLTIFTYAIEQQAFGRKPIVLHATNVALHAVTAILVFMLLQQLTASSFPAFAGALLWAIHPLRVESVVWISERKDVLCGLFYVAALIAYVRNRYWLTFALFILALLSKGTAVSLPVVLLLIDFVERRRVKWIEKVPFFALSVLFGAIGFFGQRATGSAVERAGVTFSSIEKMALSCRAILFYLGKVLLPINLSAFYPWPKTVVSADWLAVLLVVVIGLIAVRLGRPFAFAFLFFLATIAVTLPQFPFGWTMTADRYTYIPSIGVAYLVVLAVKPRFWPVIALIAALLGAAAFQRARVWHDSVSLWTSVIDLDPKLALPYVSRSAARFAAGDWKGATRDADRAIALSPCEGMALRNRRTFAIIQGDRATEARITEQLRRCSR
jgi:hypothetical protein